MDYTQFLAFLTSTMACLLTCVMSQSWRPVQQSLHTVAPQYGYGYNGHKYDLLPSRHHYKIVPENYHRYDSPVLLPRLPYSVYSQSYHHQLPPRPVNVASDVFKVVGFDGPFTDDKTFEDVFDFEQFNIFHKPDFTFTESESSSPSRPPKKDTEVEDEYGKYQNYFYQRFGQNYDP